MSMAGLKHYLSKRGSWFFILSSRGLLNWMPDEPYLKLLFKYSMGYPLDLEHPKTYNEKLQWLKLHDRRPLYTKLVDKYEVKEYVAEKIGPEYVVPVIGGPWDSVDEIDFDALPDQFVLKCTHDSGGVVICRDKAAFDREAAKAKLSNSLSRNFYWANREWPYKDVKPRVFAERLMVSDDGGQASLLDYKLLCFDGVFDNVMVCEGRFTERGTRFYFFDRDWNYLPYCPYEDLDESIFPVLKPHKLDEMIRIAETLSAGFPELRVDLYETSGKIFFGELTFFPQGGLDEEITESCDLHLGSRLDISKLGS